MASGKLYNKLGMFNLRTRSLTRKFNPQATQRIEIGRKKKNIFNTRKNSAEKHTTRTAAAKWKHERRYSPETN